MPANWLLWCSLGISFTSISLAAGCVVAYWRLASRFTRAEKRSPPSESTLAKLAVDQAEIFSSLDSLATTVKRLSSRKAMAELREERGQLELPGTLSKTELRKRIFGNKSQAEIVALARGS